MNQPNTKKNRSMADSLSAGDEAVAPSGVDVPCLVCGTRLRIALDQHGEVMDEEDTFGAHLSTEHGIRVAHLETLAPSSLEAYCEWWMAHGTTN